MKSKKFLSLVGVVVLLGTITSAFAEGVKVSGHINAEIWLQSSTNHGVSEYPNINATGTNKKHSKKLLRLEEAELKFTHKAELSNGWNAKSEVELEIGQGYNKNDFELEEASVTLDNKMISVALGLLEHKKGEYIGAASWNFEINELADGIGINDETPGLRLGYIGMKGFYGYLTVRADVVDQNGTSTTNATNPTYQRMDFRLTLGGSGNWGDAYLIAGTSNGSAIDDATEVDSNSTTMTNAGKWENKQTEYWAMIKPKFGKLAPFICYGVKGVEVMSMAATPVKATTDNSTMNLGLDFSVSEKLVVTGIYTSRELETQATPASTKVKNKQTAYALGVNYDMGAVDLSAAYSMLENDGSNTPLVTTDKDYEHSILSLGVIYAF